MTSRPNSSLRPRTFFLLVLEMSLAGLHAAAAADRAISIPIQITHAENFDPFPSPDGKKLVFISMLSGKEQLFTMDVDGSNIVQLNRDDADHEDPAWSPDGTKIAFVLITKDHHSIAVMGTDGRKRGSAYTAGPEYHSSKLVRGQQTRHLLHE
jgi:Tol biopolymer transport system component